MNDTPRPAFHEAAHRCPPSEMWVQVGALSIRMSVAGPRLAQRLFDAMRHVACETGRAADITICAWSAAETGVSAEGITWASGEPLEWIDAPARSIFSCLPGAEELSRVSIARPFQWSLVPLLAERGLTAAHGGLLAATADAPGLLLMGPNGSGKSTTCLSAIHAGFRLVGEDFLAVERTSSGYVGHSLYCSCNITRHTREMFPQLPGPLHRPYGAASDAKAILLLPAEGADSPMLRSAPIGAVVFPVITGAGGCTRAVRISRAEAYRRFLPALRQARKLSADMRRQHHDALLPLAELPAFRLELSTDVASIPPQLTEISRAVS